MATALTSALGQGGHISQQWGQTSRPFETRRLEAFSVKLNRRLRLYSYPTLDHWQTLEADPAVTAFCERPTTTYIELGGGRRLADFWVRYVSQRQRGTARP